MSESNALTERDELRSHLSIVSRTLAKKEKDLRDAMRTFEKHEAEIARRKEEIEKAEMLIEGERRRFEERMIEEERRTDEMREALEDEKRYRDGERNMSEVRIAQAKAEVEDVKKKFEEEMTYLQSAMEKLREELDARSIEHQSVMDNHRREVGQLKYDIVEMEEMMGEYRERCYDAESNLEARENELEEFKNAAGRHLEMLETSQIESAERITELEKRLELAQEEKSLLVTELENARRGNVAKEDIGDVGTVEEKESGVI
ncbi:hypothetical protein HDU67_001556 [Dinochytrium kinnereticum]|nr:hypothetical protein HDU67_001556 [Dinochytrium kinnereticum]